MIEANENTIYQNRPHLQTQTSPRTLSSIGIAHNDDMGKKNQVE